MNISIQGEYEIYSQFLIDILQQIFRSTLYYPANF